MKNMFLSRLLTRSKFLNKYVANPKNQAGYTLIEVLVVVIMVGILSAIAAPGWISFTNNQRLRTAQSQVFSSMREAQSLAKSKKIGYQVSFRERNSGTANAVAQYVVHPTASKPTTTADWDALAWQDLNFVGIARVSLGPDFNRSGIPGDNEIFNLESSAAPSIVRSIPFDSGGRLDSSLVNSTVTIGINRGGGVISGKRSCVTVTTLLGAIRSLSEGDGATCD